MNKPMLPLANAAQRYVHDTLGIPTVGCQPWPGCEQLPYFLRDKFDLWEITLLGTRVLLAIDSRQATDADSGRITTGELRRWMEKIAGLTGELAVYVTEVLASFERKRLIEYKVPFIVPGNQMYLPDLGLDLREFFRARKIAPQAISPSTQAILIAALLRPQWEPEWHPLKAARELGYTAMTVSRAVAELTALGIATSFKVGRYQYLRMVDSPRDIWERVLPMLRSPVQRTIWMQEALVHALPWRHAGLTALARHSMLAPSHEAVIAISRSAFTRALMTAESLEPAPGFVECELWSYNPEILRNSDLVDPLSLLLSLRENPNERIQQALDELQGGLPW